MNDDDDDDSNRKRRQPTEEEVDMQPTEEEEKEDERDWHTTDAGAVLQVPRRVCEASRTRARTQMCVGNYKLIFTLVLHVSMMIVM